MPDRPRVSFAEQWRALPIPAKGLLVGMLIGVAISVALTVLTVPAYLRADPSAYPPRAEILEGGVLLASLVGLPISFAMSPLLVLPFPGSWIAYIVLTPVFNASLIGFGLGTLYWLSYSRRRKRELDL